MTNHVLYISSICMSICICASYLYLKDINIYIYLYYVLGTFTSILNHGNTSNIYKWIDRIYMTQGALVNLTYIPYAYNYNYHMIYTGLACSLYLYSKICKVIYIHVCSHVFITISHLMVLHDVK
jgi:hypothetical protein